MANDLYAAGACFAQTIYEPNGEVVYLYLLLLYGTVNVHRRCHCGDLSSMEDSYVAILIDQHCISSPPTLRRQGWMERPQYASIVATCKHSFTSSSALAKARLVPPTVCPRAGFSTSKVGK